MNRPPTRSIDPLQPAPGPFGLIAWLDATRVVLPLRAVDVSFSVSGDLAEVSLDQIFHQTARQPLDVLYSFPLPAGAAVYRCELIVNDRIIQARVEEQQRARAIAHQMKAAGRRTGLVEVERDNLFTLSLGNVQPNDLIVVRFAWFQVLDHARELKSLSIPFTPGVRYIPGNPLLRSNRGKGSVDDTDQVPDASRITPPRIDELHPDAALISVTGKIDARFIETGSLSSATHPLLVRDGGKDLLVTLPPEGFVPDRDFVMRWKEREVQALDLKSIACVDGDEQYAVVRLDAPGNAPVVEQGPRDFYFLVDRSGSMHGSKWTCTARALNAFVDELGENDRVWVTLFESTFQDYAEAPIAVAELRKDPAFRSLEKLGVAGGTELLPALNHVLKQIELHSKSFAPVMIVITDGQVGNEGSVLEALRAQRDLPVHTFGIDTAVNDAFLRQLAAQNGGSCTLMTPNDDIPGAVKRLGNRLRRPVLTNLTVQGDWEATLSRLPDIHAGEHVILALKGATGRESLMLTGRLADQSAREFQFALKPEAISSPRLLWARQAIECCLAENHREEAIQLASRHNIICRGAAFIAYDMKEKVSIATEELYQPAMEVGCVMAATAPMAAPPMQYDAAPLGKKVGLGDIGAAIGDGFKRTQKLFASLGEELKPREKIAQKLRDVRARNRSGIKSDLRTEILLDAWSEKARQLPVFQTETGHVLRELLVNWAVAEPTIRLKLLEQLINELTTGDVVAVLKNFIRQNVLESRLADDMKYLTIHFSQ